MEGGWIMGRGDPFGLVLRALERRGRQLNKETYKPVLTIAQRGGGGGAGVTDIDNLARRPNPEAYKGIVWS